MYLGLIMDNIYGDRGAAPAHYQAALRAGEFSDDLLAREALRHLGDHDHDHGDQEVALERWRRATALGARAGADFQGDRHGHRLRYRLEDARDERRRTPAE